MNTKTQIQTNPHLKLGNYISQLFLKNISYIFILPLFDKLNMYIQTKMGKEISLSIFQYLKMWGVTNSYLEHPSFPDNNYLWIKAFKNPSGMIDKVVIPHYDPRDLKRTLNSMFIGSEVLFLPDNDYNIIGFPIRETFKKDVQHIMASEYSNVSESYLKYIQFRTREVYSDGSIESIIIEHAIAYHIIKQSTKFKELLSLYFNEPIENIGKNMWREYKKENEILSM